MRRGKKEKKRTVKERETREKSIISQNSRKNFDQNGEAVTGESRSFAISTAGPAVQRLVYTGDQSLIGRTRGVAVEFKYVREMGGECLDVEQCSGWQ